MERPARPDWSLSGEEILAELDALHDAQTRLTARRLELLRRLDDLGHATEVGARDTSELISLRHRLDRQVVRRDLRTAHGLDRYRTLGSRLPGSGVDDVLTTAIYGLDDRRRVEVRRTTLNPAQAATIAEILDRAPVTTRAEDLIVAEAEMVIAARTLLPRELKRLGNGVLNALDPDGTGPSGPVTSDEADRTDPVERAHAAQTLWFVPGTAVGPTGLDRVRGLRIGGFLTGEHAELLQVLVDAGAKPRRTPSGELDVRTLGQRRADAFCTVLRAAAATNGELPAHGGIKPQLSITIPYDDLTAAVFLPSAIGANLSETPASFVAGRAGTAVRGEHRTSNRRSGRMVFGEPLPAAEARRIACDAGIIPIVLGGESQPLDVGREERLVTPSIRRALIARDDGCVIPGCGAPPGHCDAHHLIHWADGGQTSLDNLALVCPTHHRAIHRGTWHVSIADGRVQTTRPRWADPSPTNHPDGRSATLTSVFTADPPVPDAQRDMPAQAWDNTDPSPVSAVMPTPQRTDTS